MRYREIIYNGNPPYVNMYNSTGYRSYVKFSLYTPFFELLSIISTHQ